MGLHNYNEDNKKRIAELAAYNQEKAAQEKATAAEAASWRSLFASEKDKGNNKLLNAYNKNYPSATDTINQYGSQQFSYNPETDANYQAYLKLARENAGLAMQDTVAKASAMTGGYSNSNAQLAGQKVYNQHLSEAEGRVGDYYAMALNAFNTNQGTLLNKINLAWQQEDRDKSDALLKAEYGDYSGLTDLGISEEAADKYAENADWATQYSKDQAAFERTWQVAKSTGDYTTLYKQLGYTDQQIAELQQGKADKEYESRDWIDKDYDVSLKGYTYIMDNLPPGVTPEFLITGLIDKADFIDDKGRNALLNTPFLKEYRTGTEYTLGETINELEKAKFTRNDIINFIADALNNA